MIETNPMATADIVLFGGNAEKLRNEAENCGMRSATFDLLDDEEKNKNQPSESGFHYFLMDTLRLIENPVEFLKYMRRYVVDQGFLLIAEVIKNQQIAEILEKSMGHQKIFFRSRKEWFEIFEQAEMELISIRVDQIMFELYLLRYRPDAASAGAGADGSAQEAPKIIECDSIENLSWVEKLQKAMEEKRNFADPTVWITNPNCYESGLRALIRAITQEDTKVMRVRSMTVKISK